MGKKRRIRRTNCSRGRLLNLHDTIRPGISRKVDMRAYISREADAYFEEKADALGITKSGLAALILEAVAVGDLATRMLAQAKSGTTTPVARAQ